ncbi:hypothetical protein [Terrisporobacter hibernicus]|uniref:Restriction endonuclease n=1 Tax=Terrisporobacter hibernicus TaxID=2813371 RepID=A0AAX2ZCY5_9FIRM|nr:hypothetical protein [Terrisporobacter hibernicus]UEL47218.1 hypothetical protein JW646_16535 [Terrisporobacter hibernicus]
MNLEGSLKERCREVISFAWDVFSKKVGNDLININKEASMQLQYAHILQQLLPIIIVNKEEMLKLELETTISDGTNNREVDLLLYGESKTESFKIAIELKCYRKIASSGGKRGATDIFMKSVYEDLCLLEKYCENNQANIGISLIMNDNENFINPKNKVAKCWKYDISDGHKIRGGVKLNTPIGGKDVNIELKKDYDFNWKKVNTMWFVEVEGKV